MKRNIFCIAALTGLIMVLFLLNGYHNSLFFRPGSYHQWRQSDCLSIAKNYYEEGMDFFSPRIHYQGVPGGKAVSEVPLLNYATAALWKLFGEHEFIYRLLVYGIYLAGLFFLLNTVWRQTGSAWVAMFAPALLLTSPMLTYYSLNFLADVPAFSLSLISFCFLFSFSQGLDRKHYYLALFLGFIATLMKASAIFPFLYAAFVGLSALLSGPRWRVVAGTPGNKWILLTVLLLMSALMFAWYRYALAYNGDLRNNVFLLTILPLWQMEEPQILYNFNVLTGEFFPFFLNRPTLGLLGGAVLYVGIHLRKLELFLRLAFVFSGLYFVAFMVLFFNVFDVHEYYLINEFMFPVIAIVCAGVLLQRSGVMRKSRWILRPLLVLLLLFNSLHCAATYRLRTFEKDALVEKYPFISKEERGMAEYLFWRYNQSTRKTEALTPALRKAGIRREDFVLSIPDPSFNITLYMMDQKGFTVSPDHITTDSTVMDRFMKRVRYIVLSDTLLKNERAFRRTQQLFEPFLEHEGVQVFKIKGKS